MDAAQMCPWISILPQKEIQNLRKEQEVLSLIKMLAKVTFQALDFFELASPDYGQLDLLIGNYGCEVHAFNMLSLAHSGKLKRECRTLRVTCTTIAEWIRGRERTQDLRKKAELFGPLNEVYTRLQAQARISQKMMYLIQPVPEPIARDQYKGKILYRTGTYPSKLTQFWPVRKPRA